MSLITSSGIRSVTETIGRSFARRLLSVSIVIAFPFVWLGLFECIRLDRQVDDEQDAKVEVAAHGTIALFSVPRSFDVSEERIEKRWRRLLERNAVLF
jgi:hypothetical protein